MALPIDGIPVNYAVRATWINGNRQTVVPTCVLCDGIHWHGYEPDLFNGKIEKSHRIAHCGVQERDLESLPPDVDDGSYWLVPDNQAWYWLISGDKGPSPTLVEKGGDTEQDILTSFDSGGDSQ